MGIGLGKMLLSFLFQKASDKREERILEKERRELQKQKQQQHSAEFVDLGLSVKWSQSNLDASLAKSRYSKWGTTVYSDSFYLDVNTPHYLKYNGNLQRYNTSSKYGTIDGWTCLLPVDDIANYMTKDKYPDNIVRMPTVEEYRELMDKCQWSFCEENQVAGYRIIGPSGNSIFMPAKGIMRGERLENNNEMGYYWTNHLGDDPMNAKVLCFDKSSRGFKDVPRYLGCKVRCVMDYSVNPEKSAYKPAKLNKGTEMSSVKAVDLGLSAKWSDTCFAKKNVTADEVVFGEWADQNAWCSKGWNLPTIGEIKELVEKCQWQRSSYFGKDGYKVIGPSGRSIFIPAWHNLSGIPPLTDDYYCDFWSSDEKNGSAAVLRVGKNAITIVELAKSEKAGFRLVRSKS